MMWKKILISCSMCIMLAMMTVSAFGEVELHVYKPMENTPGAEFGSDKAILENVQNYFLENTGVKFVSHLLPGRQYAEALNMAIAAGEKMDFFYASGFERNGYVKAKLYMPITQEMLDTYAPNAKKMWEGSWPVMKDNDGNYVAIPRNEAVGRHYPTWIRTDWLDKYGLKMPTTIEELEEVLKVFKEKKPGGPETIPMITGAGDNLNMVRYALMGGWVEPGYSMGGWLDEADGKVKPAELHPGYKDFLAKMHDWYEKGYIFKESFTMNNSGLRKLMQTGKVGVASYWGSAIGIGYEVVKEVDPEAVYVVVPGIKGPAGWIETTGKSGDNGWMISKDCKNPVELLKAIDFMYSEPEQYVVTELGIKGEQWDWTDESKTVYEQIGDRKYFQDFRFAAGIKVETQVLMKGGREFWVTHMKEEKLHFEHVKMPWDRYIRWDMTAVKSNVPRMTDLERLWDEETIKFIMGSRPLSEFDDFVKQMEKTGVEDWIKEYTRQYNAMK